MGLLLFSVLSDQWTNSSYGVAIVGTLLWNKIVTCPLFLTKKDPNTTLCISTVSQSPRVDLSLRQIIFCEGRRRDFSNFTNQFINEAQVFFGFCYWHFPIDTVELNFPSCRRKQFSYSFWKTLFSVWTPCSFLVFFCAKFRCGYFVPLASNIWKCSSRCFFHWFPYLRFPSKWTSCRVLGKG